MEAVRETERTRPNLTPVEARLAVQIADEIRKLSLVHHENLEDEITYTAEVVAHKFVTRNMRLKVRHGTMTFSDKGVHEEERFDRIELQRRANPCDYEAKLMRNSHVPMKFWQWQTGWRYSRGSGGRGIAYERMCEFCSELRDYVERLSEQDILYVVNKDGERKEMWRAEALHSPLLAAGARA